MTDKYELILAEKANYPIVKMCDWIAVSRSGFYDWQTRGGIPTAAARRRSRLTRLITAAFTASRGTYGARRIVVVLRQSGERVSARLVAELMANAQLKACQPRPWRRTTLPAGSLASRPDLIGRDFTAAAPGTKLVGDISYIRTWTGWLYLATVIDLATRKVIGWSMNTHMRTSLIVDALNMAAGTGTLQPGCIFHSDRGCPILFRRIRQGPEKTWPGRVDGPHRNLLGQCTRRILLRFTEEGTCLPYRIPHPGACPESDRRIH